jgi:hypothetical protein
MSFYLGVWNNPTAVRDDEAAPYLTVSAEKSVEPEFGELPFLRVRHRHHYT